MAKYLLRYSLLLCVLFLGGYIGHFDYGQNNLDAKDASDQLGYLQFDHANINSPLQKDDKNLFAEVTDVEEQEERDENETSHTTFTKYGSHLTAFFYTFFPVFNGLEQDLGHSDPSPIASFKRHIRFQVFRI